MTDKIDRRAKYDSKRIVKRVSFQLDRDAKLVEALENIDFSSWVREHLEQEIDETELDLDLDMLETIMNYALSCYDRYSQNDTSLCRSLMNDYKNMYNKYARIAGRLDPEDPPPILLGDKPSN